MKKQVSSQILFAVYCLLFTTYCLMFTGCGFDKKMAEAPLRVGLVFDVGGLGDKSFNDSAYNGLLMAKKEFGIYYEYIEPGEGADRESALRQLASEQFDLVFGIGFMFTDDITRIALDFPDKKFGCIDYAVFPGKEIPPNLAAIKFREDEGSFLVGAIAGLTSKTGTVGFIGGMDIPLIHKFEKGYRAGVQAVRPAHKILTAYAGVTGEAFKNPTKGKELALSQYNQGADIIYHASGSTGLGVFEAARLKKTFAIGVDSDQYPEAPGFILTSMLKRVDVAIHQVIGETLRGEFRSGIINIGLAQAGVGYVYDGNNKALISEDAIIKVEELKKRIILGQLEIK